MNARELLNNALESTGFRAYAEPSQDSRGEFFICTHTGGRLFKGRFEELYDLALQVAGMHRTKGENGPAAVTPQPAATGPAAKPSGFRA